MENKTPQIGDLLIEKHEDQIIAVYRLEHTGDWAPLPESKWFVGDERDWIAVDGHGDSVDLGYKPR